MEILKNITSHWVRLWVNDKFLFGTFLFIMALLVSRMLRPLYWSSGHTPC